jgi:hypothetical protein
MLSSLPLLWCARPGSSKTNSNLFSVPPGFSAKWDLQAQGSEVVAEFRITEYRVYDVLMLFHSTIKPFTVDVMKELFKFTGDGSTQVVTRESADSDKPVLAPYETVKDLRARSQGISEGRYVRIPAHPGVTIPVHVRVERVGAGVSEAAMIDQDFSTRSIQGSFPGFARSSPGGLARPITTVKLRPGSYRIRASTLGATAVPADVETYLTVTYRPDTRKLRDGE